MNGFHDPEHVEPECRECGAALDVGCDCAARAALVIHAADTWGWDAARWPAEDARRAWLLAECADEGIAPVMFEPWDRDVASAAADQAREVWSDPFADDDERERAREALELAGYAVGGADDQFDADFERKTLIENDPIAAEE